MECMSAQWRFVHVVAVAVLVLGSGCREGREAKAPAAAAASAASPVGTQTTYALPPSLVGTEWERLPTARKVVALTFDGCGNAGAAASILATLKQKNVPATFFLCGNWVKAFPGTARTIASRHAVGNHSSTHPHLPPLSDGEVRAEVRDGASAIAATTGADPRPLFRFPYGDRDKRTIGLVNGLGYGSIRWTVDTLGWEGADAGISVGSIVKRVLDGLVPGEIVLMHVGSANDGSTLDADALPAVIDRLRKLGYGFTDVYAYAGRYSQSVDNSSARFTASGSWGRSSWNPERHGADYRYARPKNVTDPARFRVRVPQTAHYRAYAWWPADPGYSASAPVGVDALRGLRFVRVDQRSRGGRWVLLGTFALQAGDRTVLRVSRHGKGSGYVVADAVRITTPNPP
jgi:peptidoglycan/xylan/chitin deacetylase (PgdA/CDA1 family)